MKKLFFSLLAVAAMASCSKSDLIERPAVPAASDVEILTAGKSIATRTPFDGAIASDNTLLAQVLVSLTSKDYKTLWNQKVTNDDLMEFDGDATTPQKGFKTPCYFPADGSDVYLRGFYPSTGWTVPASTNNCDYTIDGKTDVMSANEVKTNKAEALVGTYPELVFNHLLTKLIFKVEAENEAAEKAWGKITDMYLTEAAGAKITPVVRVNMTEATAVAYRVDDNGDRLDSLYCYSIDAAGKTTDKVFAHENGVGTQAAPIAGTPVTLTYAADGDTSFEAPEVAYTLVHPVTVANKHYKLIVRTENHLAAYPIDVTLKTNDATPVDFTGSTVGYAFEVKLTFNATEIMAKATVTDWKEGGVTEIPVQ